MCVYEANVLIVLVQPIHRSSLERENTEFMTLIQKLQIILVLGGDANERPNKSIFHLRKCKLKTHLKAQICIVLTLVFHN